MTCYGYITSTNDHDYLEKYYGILSYASSTSLGAPPPCVEKLRLEHCIFGVTTYAYV